MKLAVLLSLCAIGWAGSAFSQTTDEDWKARVLELYPEMGQKGTELHDKFVSLYNERWKFNPDFFHNPKWPFLLAREVSVPLASLSIESTNASTPPRRRGGRGGRGNQVALGALLAPAENPLTLDKVDLGRKLFFSTHLSANYSISCATCHDPYKAFADGRALALGVHGATGSRNTPSLVNAGYGQSYFWDGRAATLEAQVLGPIFNPKEMGLTETKLQQRTGLAPAEVAAALASYVRTIRSQGSRYDYYLAGQNDALSPLEKTGLEIFRGRGRCIRCHRGPNFTDERFHNTGVAWQKDHLADQGRFTVTADARDRGAFKTPTLREIAHTAPYMHDGSLATLDDVVEFYSQGGRSNPWLDRRMRPQRFTEKEKKALVAFMQTLSGQFSTGMTAP